MKKISKKCLWILPFLTIILLSIITGSGLCYSEMRWLSKLELVDRALFDGEFRKKAITLTHEEKIKIAADRYSAQYPNFCRVNSKPFDLTDGEAFLNSIFGLKFFEVECVYPRSVSDMKQSSTGGFFWRSFSVDACATRVVDTSGSEATEREYKFFLKRNQRFWRDHE